MMGLKEEFKNELSALLKKYWIKGLPASDITGILYSMHIKTLKNSLNSGC